MGLHNLARVVSATTGTGAITLGAAVSGFLTFADAGVIDAETLTYAIRDGAESEIGIGTYTSSGTTLSRDTVLESTNSGNAINCSGSEEVFVTASAEDLSGRRVLISEVTPTGVGTVTLSSSIPAYYKCLVIEFAIRGTQVANAVDGYLQFNGDTTSGNYVYAEAHRNAAGHGSASSGNGIFAPTGISAANAPAGGFAVGTITIPQYANTNVRKSANAIFTMEYDASSVYIQMFQSSVRWANAAAITRVDIALSAGNFAANTVIRLYGLF
jgi:hypothetical protein